MANRTYEEFDPIPAETNPDDWKGWATPRSWASALNKAITEGPVSGWVTPILFDEQDWMRFMRLEFGPSYNKEEDERIEKILADAGIEKTANNKHFVKRHERLHAEFQKMLLQKMERNNRRSHKHIKR